MLHVQKVYSIGLKFSLKFNENFNGLKLHLAVKTCTSMDFDVKCSDFVYIFFRGGEGGIQIWILESKNISLLKSRSLNLENPLKSIFGLSISFISLNPRNLILNTPLILDSITDTHI